MMVEAFEYQLDGSALLALLLGDCICLTSAAAANRVAITAERLRKPLEVRPLAGGALRVEWIR